MVIQFSDLRNKLKSLAQDQGFTSIQALLEAAALDSVCSGICMHRSCGYTAEVERNQCKGYCKLCGTQTVKSALVLGGLI